MKEETEILNFARSSHSFYLKLPIFLLRTERERERERGREKFELRAQPHGFSGTEAKRGRKLFYNSVTVICHKWKKPNVGHRGKVAGDTECV